jgi:hypothetical protein
MAVSSYMRIIKSPDDWSRIEESGRAWICLKSRERISAKIFCSYTQFTNRLKIVDQFLREKSAYRDFDKRPDELRLMAQNGSVDY